LVRTLNASLFVFLLLCGRWRLIPLCRKIVLVVGRNVCEIYFQRDKGRFFPLIFTFVPLLLAFAMGCLGSKPSSPEKKTSSTPQSNALSAIGTARGKGNGTANAIVVVSDESYRPVVSPSSSSSYTGVGAGLVSEFEGMESEADAGQNMAAQRRLRKKISKNHSTSRIQEEEGDDDDDDRDKDESKNGEAGGSSAGGDPSTPQPGVRPDSRASARAAVGLASPSSGRGEPTAHRSRPNSATTGESEQQQQQQQQQSGDQDEGGKKTRRRKRRTRPASDALHRGAGTDGYDDSGGDGSEDGSSSAD
jgi:hypothetical protein